MLRYVLKRLLLLLPTLWIICSLVFLISRIVPGTCRDVELERTDQSFSASGPLNSAVITDKVFPLFYFSVHSQAEPDTLATMQPESHQMFLKALVLQSGNWPEVVNFYRHILALQRLEQVSGISNATKKSLNRQLKAMFSLRSWEQVAESLAVLRKQAQQQQWPSDYSSRIKVAQKQVTYIQAHRQQAQVLLPAFTWHGTTNQYHSWFSTFITGDLGVSCRSQQSVTNVIADAFYNTFFMAVLSLTLIFLLAVELCIWLNKAAFHKWRQPVLNILYVLDSVPLFIIALALVTFFASSTYLNLFPVYGAGAYVPTDAPFYLAWLYQLQSLLLPVICLTIINLPYVAGQIQQAIEQVQAREFILTAKAKGLPESTVLRRHVLRNALLPIITLSTGFLPALVTGALVIEIIYNIPGMGRLLNETILGRDYPVLLGIVLCLGIIMIVSHILADVLYYLADPRIRVKE